MALSSTKTGKKVADIILASDAPDDMKAKITKLWQDIMDAIYTDIKSDMVVTVPQSSVIISVAGGSGAPATGTPNPAPIQCGVDASS